MTDSLAALRRLTRQGAPDWRALLTSEGPVDWDRSALILPGEFAAMRDCMQDAVFHAEGDVLTHTRMVCDALERDAAFDSLDDASQKALRLAALLHDVEKPGTRMVEFDAALGRERVRHPHHAARGARSAFSLLWLLGAPLELRIAVHDLIAWHQKVFHCFGANDERAQLIRFSQTGRWRDLLMLARADNRGRLSPNTDDTALTLELLGEAAREAGLWTQPFAFPDAVARQHFLGSPGRSEWTTPGAPKGSRVIVLCGLPGVGKSTYAEGLGVEIISFDAERERLGLKPGETGEAVVAAFEKAREALRRKRPFVFANTSITRLQRGKIIALALDYDAFVEIHALDAPIPQILARNAARPAAVPEAAMAAMLDKFEPPTIVEAHEVRWIDASSQSRERLAHK